MKLWKELSDSLRIASLLAILAIVAIHYNTQPFPGVYTWNFLAQEVIHNIMGRAAVPAFALISGLLFFQGKAFSTSVLWEKLTSRFKTTIAPALLVTCALWWYAQYESSVLQHNPFNWNTQYAIASWLFYPPGSQFWFLRDLLILFLITPYIFIAIMRFGLAIPALLLICWGFDWQLLPIWESRYFINNDTYTFFVLGAYISLREKEVIVRAALTLDKKIIALLVIVYAAAAATRIYIDPTISLWYPAVFTWKSLALQKSIILMGIYLLFVTSYYLNSTRLRARLIRLSGYSFFIFLLHDYPLKVVLWEPLVSIGVTMDCIFYVRYCVAIGILLFFARLLETSFPHFFSWLCGGRNHQGKAPSHTIANRNKGARDNTPIVAVMPS